MSLDKVLLIFQISAQDRLLWEADLKSQYRPDSFPLEDLTRILIELSFMIICLISVSCMKVYASQEHQPCIY